MLGSIGIGITPLLIDACSTLYLLLLHASIVGRGDFFYALSPHVLSMPSSLRRHSCYTDTDLLVSSHFIERRT